jgi:peptide deformylase
MAAYRIRTFGDPVLKRRAEEVTDIDGRIAQLAEEMHATLKEAHGLGLAAPQVGVGRRLFVYEKDGEWEYEEGCLSVPGLYFPITRAKHVFIKGYDLDGREVSVEADDMEAKLYQHELDHLDGRLLLDLLDADQRKQAMRELRRRAETEQGQASPAQR